MVLRQRKPSNVQESVQNVVQEMDVFDKVDEHYVEQSVLGASGASLLIIPYDIFILNFILIFILSFIYIVCCYRLVFIHGFLGG